MGCWYAGGNQRWNGRIVAGHFDLHQIRQRFSDPICLKCQNCHPVGQMEDLQVGLIRLHEIGFILIQYQPVGDGSGDQVSGQDVNNVGAICTIRLVVYVVRRLVEYRFTTFVCTTATQFVWYSVTNRLTCICTSVVFVIHRSTRLVRTTATAASDPRAVSTVLCSTTTRPKAAKTLCKKRFIQDQNSTRDAKHG